MTDLTPALLCAAHLLGYTGPLPEVMWWKDEPIPELCAAANAPGCLAITTRRLDTGGLMVVMPADAPFSWAVHEATHVLQLHLGLPYPNEEQAYELMARAGECEEL